MTFKNEIHRFDIQTDIGYLETAMHLAFYRDICKGWRIDNSTDGHGNHAPRLIMYNYWDKEMVNLDPSDPKNVYPLPVPSTSSQMSRLVKNWLDQVDYGPEPRTDGPINKGFRIYNEDQGKVDGSWAGIAAVEPVWLFQRK